MDPKTVSIAQIVAAIVSIVLSVVFGWYWAGAIALALGMSINAFNDDISPVQRGIEIALFYAPVVVHLAFGPEGSGDDAYYLVSQIAAYFCIVAFNVWQIAAE